MNEFTDMWLDEMPMRIELEPEQSRQSYCRKRRVYTCERQANEKVVASRRKKAKLARQARRKGRK